MTLDVSAFGTYWKPKLSIITACYNHAKYLPACIASVRGQSEPLIEHIIINDASTDNTRAILLDAYRENPARVRTFNKRVNRGLASVMNFGISQAKAPWVMKVDADDYIAPTYVEEILRAASENQRANVIFSPAQHVGNRTDVYRYPSYDASRIVDRLMLAGCAAIKKEVIEAVGGHDETMRFAEDWDMYIRAERAVGLVPHQLDAPRWFYRVHDGPRASAEGIKHIKYLQAYWRGHTKETALARSRTWAAWCEEKGLESGHVTLGDDPTPMTLITHT